MIVGVWAMLTYPAATTACAVPFSDDIPNKDMVVTGGPAEWENSSSVLTESSRLLILTMATLGVIQTVISQETSGL